MQYNTNILFLFTIILLFLFNCSKNPIGDDDKKITVTIINQNGEPIEGAYIEGGLGWTRFKVKTNEYGKAKVPYGEKGSIYRTNYFPKIVNNLYSSKYQLEETPKKVKLIDSIKGKEAVVFNSDFIVTIGYEGLYFLYSYNDESVNEIGQHQIAKTYKQIKLIGDLL